MKIIAALLVISAGCGEVAVEHEPTLLERLEAVEVTAPGAAEAATAIVLQSYADQLGVAMPTATVRWFGEQLPIGDGIATGVCISCDSTWVWTEPGRRIGDTALAHELGHCARNVLGLYGEHEDPAWWSFDGYVGKAQRALEASGL